MKKSFFQIMVVALIGFATWAFMRNSIWGNPDLYPDERLMIYARDGSSYFIALRFFFVAMWGWAAYLLWTTGKSTYTWFAVAFYAGFLLVDSWILGAHYLQYKAENAEWAASFPYSFFRGFPEAVFTVLLSAFAVFTLKKGRAKRQSLGGVEYVFPS